MSRLRRLTALLLSLCLLAGCAATSGTEPIQTPAQTPTDTPDPEPTQKPAEAQPFALSYAPASGLNPYSCTDLTNRTLLALLYESLFRVDAAFQPQPQLCKTYSVSGGGRTHTVVLKDGVTFSDGAAMTANDVAASIRAAIGSAYYGTRLSHVSSVLATDTATVVLTTDTAYETLAPLLDMPIVKTGTASDPVPVGSGPYTADLEGQRLRRADWWQTADPSIDETVIELVLATTPVEVRDSFEYGAVGLVCADPNANGAATYHSDFELWSSNTTVMQYLGFNLASPVFSIAPLRAAITHAIDRDAIIAGGAEGFAVSATLPVSPFADTYNARLAENYGFNPAAFQSALRQSQISDMVGADGVLDMYTNSGTQPLSGRLLVCSDSEQRVQTARQIADALGALGFDLELVSLPRQGYEAALRAGNFDLYYGEVRLAPNFDLSAFFRAGAALSYGGIADGALETLCRQTLENSGNAYDLYQTIMDRGVLCPVLFKTYAVYTARGRLPRLSPALDCVLYT